MMHSVKVTKRNSPTDDQMAMYPQHPYYFHQQMYYPPSRSISPTSLYNYSDYDSRRSSLMFQTSDQSLVKKTVPDMEHFLKCLDQEYGDNKFTGYLSIFQEHEILVSQLARLSDSEYISMGITIIGRRQILRDEAKKYE